MDGKTLARIGAVIFVAIAIVATAIEMNRKPSSPDSAPTVARPVLERDALDVELARCSGIGEAGAHDPSCLKAWGQARRRFLGQPTSSAPAAPATSATPPTLFPSETPAAPPAESARQSQPAQPPASPDAGAH